MTPLREKLNSSLCKWGDKLKRARSSDDTSSEIRVKQPRTLPELLPSNSIFAHSGSSFQEQFSPPKSPFQCSPREASQGIDATKLLGPIEFQGNFGDPIDLTISPSPSPLSSFTYASPATQAANSPVVLTNHQTKTSPQILGQKPGGGIQTVDDEKVALALHNELNRTRNAKALSKMATSRAGFDEELRQFLSAVDQKRCPKCNLAHGLRRDQVVSRTKAMLKDEGVLHPYVQCRKCKVWMCMGCSLHNDRSIPSFDKSITGRGFKIAWCCGQSKLYLIWSIACGPVFKKLDPVASASRSGVGSRLMKYKLRSLTKKDDAPKPAANPKDKPPGGNEAPVNPSEMKQLPTIMSSSPVLSKIRAKHSTQLPKGTGYGGFGGYSDDESPVASKKKRLTSDARSKPSRGRKEDGGEAMRHFEVYFHALSILLPSAPGSQGLGSDLANGSSLAITSMISRSPLLPMAVEMLRNDSLDEISQQERVYTSILDFVERLGQHPSTYPLVFRDLCVYRPEDQLVHVNHILHRLGGDISTGVEKSQALFAVLANLSTQCRHFVTTSAAHLQMFQEPTSESLLQLAQRVNQIYQDLETVRQALGIDLPASLTSALSSNAGAGLFITRASGPNLTEEIRKAREKWHREHSVDEVTDEALLQVHTHASLASGLGSSGQTLGRMKKLVTQVASLRTSLPEGIYVRHCSSRLDVMKVLIMGPRGTPYEHGLFEFDLFCPGEFPTCPPLMQFRTTGNGYIRFNPNLYECGKVCLSLLGTWSGQSWTEQSTILQILVSIQAMIFSENPWYNEPGRERTENPKASEQYNKQIQRWTVEHAILYWLNSRLAQPDPPAAKPRPENPPAHHGSRLLQSFLPTGSGGGSKQAAAPPPYKPRSAIDQGPKPTLPELPTPDSKTFFNFLSPPIVNAEPGSGIPTPPEPKMFHWMDDMVADGGQETRQAVFVAEEEEEEEGIPHASRPSGIGTNASKPAAGGCDDPIWGPVIRHHFRANGRGMLSTFSRLNTYSGKGKGREDALVKELEDALVRHGFL